MPKKKDTPLTLDPKYTGRDENFLARVDPQDYRKLVSSITQGLLIYNHMKSGNRKEAVKRSIESTMRKIDALPKKRKDELRKHKNENAAKEELRKWLLKNPNTKGIDENAILSKLKKKYGVSSKLLREEILTPHAKNFLHRSEICVKFSDEPTKPCPGNPDDYTWVSARCNDGFWRKIPKKRTKHSNEKNFDDELLKTVKLLQKALLRYAGTIDPKSLEDAGKAIKDVKVIHASGAKAKYKHPSGIGKRSGYTIQYACVDLHDLITSHKPLENFKPDSRFPQKIQDRDYQKQAEKNKVVDIALKLQPEYMLSQAVTAAEGTPVVTKDMIVLSGNGRVQGLKYASEHSPVNYKKYKLEAIEQAPKFALLREEVKQFEHPCIVRFVNINATTNEAIDFGHAANSKVGAERSEIREAAHIAEILPPEMLALVKDANESTLSGILDQKEFRLFLKNSIPGKDHQKYFKDTGKLTDSGKIFVKKMLLIKCLGSPETLENMSEQHLLMFTNALPALVEVRQRESSGNIASKYSISGLIAETLRFLKDEILKAGYKNFEDFRTQKSFLEKKKAPKHIEEFLKILEEISKKGKLLAFYLIQLAKDCTAESNLSSGMFSEVKELPFQTIIKDAYPKAENSYKLYKQKGIKDNITPVMFGEISKDDLLEEIKVYAETLNLGLSGMSKSEHLKQSRKYSKQGNVALALKHLSSALKSSTKSLGDITMRKPAKKTTSKRKSSKNTTNLGKTGSIADRVTYEYTFSDKRKKVDTDVLRKLANRVKNFVDKSSKKHREVHYALSWQKNKISISADYMINAELIPYAEKLGMKVKKQRSQNSTIGEGITKRGNSGRGGRGSCGGKRKRDGSGQTQTNGKRAKAEYKGKPTVTQSVSYKRKKVKADAKTSTKKASKGKNFTFKGLGELGDLPIIKIDPRAKKIVDNIARKRLGKPTKELELALKGNLIEAKKAFDAKDKAKMDKHLAFAAGTRAALKKKAPKNRTLAKFSAYFDAMENTT